jgi:hypothetical protein
MTPAPKPLSNLEPSKCMRQWVESEAGGRYWCSPQSAKKSAMIYDLIVVLGLY